MKTAYVTEKKVHHAARIRGLTVEVIRPGGRANKYRLRDKNGKLLGEFTGAPAAMAWMEEQQ